ncbi:hypothetical protein GQ457_05G022080 [Hibiscus cannabinus]
MADSLLAKLGDLTFTAEEQDAVVVTPDAVAIPAEDFASSLMGKVVSPPSVDGSRLIPQFRSIWKDDKVRIHNIPLSLMTAALARVLGASIGKVIMTDTRLEDGNMGEFMRVRVLFDTSKPLRRCVVLSRPDAKASMCPLQYERLPLFCHGCGLIGHSILACLTTPKWRERSSNMVHGYVPHCQSARPLGPVGGYLLSMTIWMLLCQWTRPPRALLFALVPTGPMALGCPYCGPERGLPPWCPCQQARAPVNHMLFADDSLVFLRNDMTEVHCLKDILTTYSAVSGQKVNFSKSTAYFSPRTPPEHRIAVHEALGVWEVSDPGIYLGVPLLIGKNKYAAFGRYRDKVDTRVSKWSNLLLSFSGHEVLVGLSPKTIH